MDISDYSVEESGQGVKVTTHLPANARIVAQIRPQPLPSTFFPVYYSLIILLLDATELLTAVLNKL
jgi:hypothetical protein